MGSYNNNNNNNNNGRRQGGVRKEEIQQWGTNTLMRTAKKTHNFKFMEKCLADRDGIEISFCSEKSFPEN